MTPTTSYKQVARYKRFQEFLLKVNLFDNDDNDNEKLSLVDQLLATRVFLFLLAITLFIVVIFTAFSPQTHTVTVQSPSVTTFNELSIQYSSTLSCSCQQSFIRQDQFLSFDPQYHPICSSQFVNQTFISSSFSDMNMSNYWPLDYRLMIASHFQHLALLCQTVKQTVVDALAEFATGHIISNQVLFPDVFDAQTSALVESLKTTTVSNHKYMSDFLWFSISQNGISSALRSNAYIQYIPGASAYHLLSASYQYSNDSCSCRRNNTCFHQAGIYNRTGRAGVNTSTRYGNVNTDPPLLFSIPGIMIGCLPYYSLLQSTLACFYNQSCIDRMQSFINPLSLVSPLSSSSSRFVQNTTVNELLNELLIESWHNQSNFTEYFQVCSPHFCSHSYNRRFNVLYIIVTLISLFGGLRIITYFSAPYLIKIMRKLQKSRCCHNTTKEITTVPTVDPSQSKYFLILYFYVFLNICFYSFKRSSDVSCPSIVSTNSYIQSVSFLI